MMGKPVPKRYLLNPLHCLSLGLGTGLLPMAPGTWGSLLALPAYLYLSQFSLLNFIIITVLVSLFGIYCTGYTSKALGVHDHSAIVFDEVAGMFISLLAIPATMVPMAIAFAWFRLFDIVKPWPIRLLDKQVHGGLGIMLDDIVAGLFACVCSHLTLSFM